MKKIKFNDIQGMLARDEMKQFIGGAIVNSDGSEDWQTLPEVTVNYNNNYNNKPTGIYWRDGYNGFGYYYYNYDNQNKDEWIYDDGNRDNLPWINNYNGKDPIELSNLPINLTKQIGNMCTMEAFTFVANYLGETNTVGSIALELAKELNDIQIIVNGLDPIQNEKGINLLFDSTKVNTISLIQNAIDNKHPVITFINTYDNNNNPLIVTEIGSNGKEVKINIQHEVVIVGYNSDKNQVKIADSGTGEYRWIDSKEINLSNSYQINKNK